MCVCELNNNIYCLGGMNLSSELSVDSIYFFDGKRSVELHIHIPQFSFASACTYLSDNQSQKIIIYGGI